MEEENLKLKIADKYKNKWYRQNTIVVLLCILLAASLSIAYATILGQMSIETEGYVRAIRDIRVINIENQNDSCGYDKFYPKYDIDSITVNLDLPSLDCTVEYKIKIYNKGLVPMEITDIILESYNNVDIIYEIDGIKIESVIDVEQTVEATLKFRYNPTIQTLPQKTDLGSIIKFAWQEYVDDNLGNLPEIGLFTYNILESGIKNVTNGANIVYYPNGGYDDTPILSIIGRPPTGWDAILRNNMIRWAINIDMTSYSKLYFWARLVQAHGSMGVWIGETRAIFYNYGDYGWHGNSQWTYYEIDVSAFTGIQEITFIGGYTDWSGNANSQTQYSNINLVKMP